MFAVIKSGGKQYRVASNAIITVERMLGEKGDKVEFGEVLMMGDKIGAPLLSGVKVTGTVVEHNRNDTVIVFKKKRRQNYRRKNGHRQHQTVIKIDEIA